MKVWILNHYGSQPGKGRFERPTHLARRLAGDDIEVSVFYSSNHHLLYEDALEGEEEVDGTTYVALKCRDYEGNGLGRVLNMWDFHRSLIAYTKESGKHPDVVVASSPHPFVWLSADFLKRKLGTKTVLEIRDLWPESIVEFSSLKPWHPFVLLVGAIVNHAYKNADRIVTLLPGSEKLIAETRGKEDICYIPNGVQIEDGEASEPTGECGIVEYIKEKQKAGKFVLVYTGAIGPPNGIGRVVELYDHIGNEERDYHIVIVGDGVDRAELAGICDRAQSNLISFHGKVEKSRIPKILDVSDACLFSLRPSPVFEHGLSPNKLFDYLKARKPVLWFAGTKNDPVTECGAGIASPESASELDQALTKMSSLSKEELEKMGRSGFEYLKQNHDWEVLGSRYKKLLFELCNSRG